ncbi:DHH family phosphoesterase [Sulfurimonas sp.]
MTNRTIHHLSHIDLDGYSCQLVMKYTPYKKFNYNSNYGAEIRQKLDLMLENIRKDKTDAYILITDLNLTADDSRWLTHEVKKINDQYCNLKLQLLDHHGSGAQSAKKFDWYYLDEGRSATKITYDFAKEHFEFNEPQWMKKYVDVVNAVDLWLQEEHENFEYGKVCMRLVNETRELNRIMFADEDSHYKLSLLQEAVKCIHEPKAPILLDEKIHRLKKDFFREDEEDNTLDNLATKYVVKLLGKARNEKTIYYKGYRGYLSYGVGNTSIVGNGFLTAYPEYDFIVDVSYRGTMSLRANNQVSVAQISKEWANGGGHPNAAGGRIMGFKEQYRYDKVKQQIEQIINDKESVAGDLEYKKED